MPYEAEPGPPPSHEELNERMNQQYADTMVHHNGVSMPFKQFVGMRDALCPVEPNAADDLVFKANLLANSDVELDADYTTVVEQIKVDKITEQKEITQKAESAESKVEDKNSEMEVAVSTGKVINYAPSVKAEVVSKSQPRVSPQVLARIVHLVTKDVIAEPVIVKSIQIAKKAVEKPELQPLIPVLTNESLLEKQSDSETLPYLTHEIVDVSPQFGTPATEISPDSIVEDTLTFSPEEEFFEIPSSLSEEIYQESDSTISNDVVISDVELTVPTELVGYDLKAETEVNEFPIQSEIYEEVEKSPSVAVAEFMLQVLPAVTQEFYVRVQEMEPEAAAEVAAQVESIIIVSDRLHVLVLEGRTEGEEAKQIEVYLKREYEQLLVAIGIEPTEEILNDFIRYIYSAEYQIREEISLNELEVLDEGTHEKKLFDEEGVFSRAHAASLNLSRRLDKSIGRLVVNYFSS